MSDLLEVPISQDHIDEGEPREAEACAVTLAIKELGMFLSVMTTDDEIYFETADDGECFKIEPQESLAKYIYDFDSQGFPWYSAKPTAPALMVIDLKKRIAYLKEDENGQDRD